MALVDHVTHWWTLNEASGTRADEVGAFDLTDNNTVGSTTGKVGDAAAFVAASSEYLSRSGTDLSPGDTSWSMCVWVRTSNTGANQGIWCKDNGSQREYALLIYAGAIRFIGFDSGGGFYALDSAAIASNTWYCVVAGYDASTNKAFLSIDGGAKQESSTFSPYATASATPPSTLGLWEYVGWYLSGDIDEAAWCDAALSDAEIDEYYNGGSGLTYDDLTSPPATRASLLTLLGVS